MKTNVQPKTWMQKFITLFVITPNLKQFQYPSTSEWIELMVYSYNEILLCSKMEWTTGHNMDTSQK